MAAQLSTYSHISLACRIFNPILKEGQNVWRISMTRGFMGRFVFISIILLCCSHYLHAFEPCLSGEKTPKVVLVIPDSKDPIFWGSVAKIAQEASTQMNIDLTIYDYNTSEGGIRFTFPVFLKDVLTKESDADYIVTKFHLKIEQKILEIAQAHKIKLFTFNSSLPAQLIKQIGIPRQYNKNWIAHIESDEYQTGYDLADKLIGQAHVSGQKIAMLAINGGRYHEAAKSRMAGMHDRLKASPNVDLLQLVYTNWSYQQAREKAAFLLKRFTDIDVIWTASDTIAKAVADEIKHSNNGNLKHIKIGGIDWAPHIIPYLAKNEVSVSYGGHVFDIAYLLGVIADYHNAYDQTKIHGTLIKNTNSPLKTEYADLLLTQNFKRFDFKRLSYCHSKAQVRQDYGIWDLVKD